MQRWLPYEPDRYPFPRTISPHRLRSPAQIDVSSAPTNSRPDRPSTIATAIAVITDTASGPRQLSATIRAHQKERRVL
jgi:hypothetical protein